jgi:hypothetical protein
MLKLIFIVFIILHGLVHLLYYGQSARYFELNSGMTWPDGSWLFSKISSNETIRMLSNISCILVAFGFVVGGIIIVIGQSWWIPIIIVAAIFSSLVFIVFWNGQVQKLADQGLIAVLLNIAVLILIRLMP